MLTVALELTPYNTDQPPIQKSRFKLLAAIPYRLFFAVKLQRRHGPLQMGDAHGRIFLPILPGAASLAFLSWRRLVVQAGIDSDLPDYIESPLLHRLNKTAPHIPAIGRVEMWRDGLRSSLSVAAPFVWRCLNSRTITSLPPLTAPIASGWSNIAGWDSHPLRNAAFARRTPEPFIPRITVGVS